MIKKGRNCGKIFYGMLGGIVGLRDGMMAVDAHML